MKTRLAVAAEYLAAEVAPHAAEIDQSPAALERALAGLGARDLLALRCPAEYGGPGVDDAEFRQFQELIARTSGALAFLQTQHQSAASLLSKSNNEALKAETLPKMGTGERRIGIGFSQLRRPGAPMTRAKRVDGGYELNGLVPWITGYMFFPEFMVGASLESGEAVFGILPFIKTDTLSFSEPMKLAAMESGLTVAGEINRHFLPDELVVDVKPEGWIFRNDQINITLQGFFALGCAAGSLDVLETAFARKQHAAIEAARSALESEVIACRSAMMAAQVTSGDLTTEEKLNLRGWAIDLAMRCAHAAVAASGGAANMASHPAQRLLREALVYTVSAQTEPIMEATLSRLIRAEV